jgi:aspartyl protease family protein
MSRRKFFRPFLVAFMFFVAGGLPQVNSTGNGTGSEMFILKAVTELRASGNGHFVTTASINNRDVEVLVDTGASVVALSYDDARQIGLRPGSLSFDIPVSTANGVTKAARVTLKEVEIDGVRVGDVPGIVMPEGAMNGSLLGMSFLSRLSSFKVEDGVLYLRK